MGDVIDLASSVLAQAAQRLDVAGQNISNATVNGYKRVISFSSTLSASKTDNIGSTYRLDLTPGKEVQTGNSYDLSIEGDGFFIVASPHGLYYTRAGQFQRDGDGRLLTSAGLALQSDSGGDLTLSKDKVQVQLDGTVLEDGQPTGKIAIAAITDPSSAQYVGGGVISAPESAVGSVDAPSIRQGSYEASNVSSSTEMVSMMLALRQAEAGQKLVNVYDEMMGRVIDSFSQAGGS